MRLRVALADVTKVYAMAVEDIIFPKKSLLKKTALCVCNMQEKPFSSRNHMIFF